MNIKKYIERVVTTTDEIFLDVYLSNTKEEAEFLERLCTSDIPRERMILAWSMIIGSLSDLYHFKHVECISTKCLEYLVSNKICLVDLSHINIGKKWLEKIYKLDNSIFEALENINEYNNLH